MKLIHKFQKLFLYAGVEKEEYKKLLPEIYEENRVLLRLFSEIAAVMFFVLFLASMISGGFASANSSTYLVCGIEAMVILLCARFILPKHPSIVMVLVYLFEIMLYIFGIHISMLHAEVPAVSAVAFLLVSPLLFYDRPVRLSALIVIVVAVFCTIVTRFKEPEIAQKDVWNMITFGVVAIATTVFIMSIKFRALEQSRQIEYLSETDLLTGVKNRNHYENRLQGYPELCTSNLICIYADVNGLHEVNYRLGHSAGDCMLRETAEAMQQFFGQEHTYRIGGDEFIAFRADGQPEEVLPELDQIRQALNAKGYHVSFGVAVYEKTQGNWDVAELVREAEANMFADKRAFYDRAENDRRNR